ncbi:MAG: acyltransferase [Deltaproteobacteria bacterium]|nr:acyltransferase [Deltaproteobacteria bacterium]
MPGPGIRLQLKTLQAYDRFRLRRLMARHRGLEIHPAASSNLAAARYDLAAGARLRIGAGVVTERLAGALHFSLGAGAEVSIGEGTWLRTEIAPVHIVAFEGARIELGPESFLNGCQLSAKSELRCGRRAWIGSGSRVFDSDQHDLDSEHPEVTRPVTIGDCVWVAADVTILRGVTIGEHSVIGTRSLVTRDIPPHTLAYGQPARPRGSIGDRSTTR